MTMGEYFEKHPAPKTPEEMEKYAHYFYTYNPAVQNYVDSMFEFTGEMLTLGEVARILTPAFKMLAYNDFCRLEKFEKKK